MHLILFYSVIRYTGYQLSIAKGIHYGLLRHSGLVPLDEALVAISNQSIATDEQNASPLHALDRIIAEDITASLNVLPQNNSAMDGYAFAQIYLLNH